MSQEITIDVWSDFVCPWCFLASITLKQLETSHNINLRWRSYELRPQGSPPMPEWYKEKIEAQRPQLIAIAKTQYGIDIKHGPLGINSRPALMGMKYAETQDKGDDYHKQVFSAYFESGLNIEDINVLREIAVGIGLDANEFESALSNPDFDIAVTTDVQTAQAFGVTGVPSMLFNNKYRLSGTQPYEELVRIVDQIQQRDAIH